MHVTWELDSLEFNVAETRPHGSYPLPLTGAEVHRPADGNPSFFMYFFFLLGFCLTGAFICSARTNPRCILEEPTFLVAVYAVLFCGSFARVDNELQFLL